MPCTPNLRRVHPEEAQGLCSCHAGCLLARITACLVDQAPVYPNLLMRETKQMHLSPMKMAYGQTFSLTLYTPYGV